MLFDLLTVEMNSIILANESLSCNLLLIEMKFLKIVFKLRNFVL